MGQHHTSIYTPLNAARPSIRLLAIEDVAKHDDRLVCHLKVTNLDQCPPYAALSYVWGSPSLGLEPITVNGSPVDIGVNLAAALRFFRTEFKVSTDLEPKPSRYIWVDALCINQADNKEKAVQVGRMDLIYKSASVVISHLGLGNALAREGVEVIRALSQTWRRLLTECERETSSTKGPANLIAEGENTEASSPLAIRSGSLLLDEERTTALLEGLASTLNDQSWEAVQSCLDLPYWSRIWIVQEIVLGRKILLVLAGTTPLSWEQIRDAKTLTAQIPTILSRLKLYNSRMWSQFEGSAKLSWDRIDLIRQYKEPGETRYLRRKENGKVLLAYSLNVLFRTLGHLATDPRDKIFGLRGICELPVEPDYDRPFEEVYIKFGIACAVYELFNFIHCAGTGLRIPRNSKLPSWVPDWQQNSLSHWQNPINPEWYEASGWIDPFPKPSLKPNGDNFTCGFGMKVRGSFCDSIAKVWPNMPVKSREIFDMCCGLRASSGQQWPLYKTGIPMMQALLRTLSLDRRLGDVGEGLKFDQGDFDDILSIVLDFLTFVIPEEAFLDEGDKLLEESLSKLGLDPGFKFPKTLKAEYFPNHSSSLMTEIDWSELSEDTLRAAFPGQQLGELRDRPPIKTRGVEVVRRGTSMPSRELFLARIASWMDQGYRVFETTTGYLGIGPPDMQEGDEIYVIRRCSTPVILRRQSEESLFEETSREAPNSTAITELVGSCFLLGFMQNELGVKDDYNVCAEAPVENEAEEEAALEAYIEEMFPSVLIIK